MRLVTFADVPSVFAIPLLLILAVQPILFHVIVGEGHFMLSGAHQLLMLCSKPGGYSSCMGYIGMCGPKGYGFAAILVINRVSIFAL